MVTLAMYTFWYGKETSNDPPFVNDFWSDLAYVLNFDFRLS